MSAKYQLLIACLLAGSAAAEFRTWTRSDGKTAELTDLQGKLLKTSYDEQGKYMGPTLVMNHLESLLKP